LSRPNATLPENFHATLLQQLACGVWATDRDDRIVYWNPAMSACSGLSGEDVLGRHWLTDFPGAPFERIAPLYQKAKDSLAPVTFRAIPITLPSGRTALLSGKFAPLRRNGCFDGVVGNVQDISEAERDLAELERSNVLLEQRIRERTRQLETANAELETFAYSVSHDLKAPLRGIDGYSRLLLTGYAASLPAEAQTFLANIRQGVRMMNALIEDLLAYSRVERRKLESHPIRLDELVSALLNERRLETNRSGVSVSVDLPDATVRGDPDGLALVLRNLLDNALKFSAKHPNPAIEIGGRHEHDSYVCWIKDNGVGFDMKY